MKFPTKSSAHLTFIIYCALNYMRSCMLSLINQFVSLKFVYTELLLKDFIYIYLFMYISIIELYFLNIQCNRF
jgi:hypothetical protein